VFAARVLAAATQHGLAALIGVELFAAGLEAAGVDLSRLLLVVVREAVEAVRTADIFGR
jgi:hypothetical protein